jgi:beta-galactosidase
MLGLHTAVYAGTFSTDGGKFTLNGKPFQIIAGEMHYARIPRGEWESRLKMARLMGLNTISTYVFWNYHEPKPGMFDFKSDNRDLAEFLRMAQRESLYVILRPGPYACAEWDFGGFPSWLLKDHDLKVRSQDENFLKAANEYIHRLGEEVAPLQITNGGPIIMVQVENEYGSYGNDTVYEGKIRDMIRSAGFTVPLFTADGSSECRNAHLAGVLPAINGEDNAQRLRDTVNKYNGGQGPYFVPEFYPGWLDHWGEDHANVPDSDFLPRYDTLISQGVSVSLYMFHGGTNFGFMNGANYGGHYQPQPTSYDYDAPLDEAGRPTEKYFALAKLLRGHVPDSTEYTIPRIAPPMNINLTQSTGMFDQLALPIHSDSLLSMEDIGQSYGYMLYRTKINTPVTGTLRLEGLRDYAIVFINAVKSYSMKHGIAITHGKKIASLDRRHKQEKVQISISKVPATLDILVENGGRVNYGKAMLDNRKGIISRVTLNGKLLTGWDIYPISTDPPLSKYFADGGFLDAPAYYKGSFVVYQAGGLFLDMRQWGKGCVWVNGHCIGRYWGIGPQQTLYVPEEWLRTQQIDSSMVDWAMLLPGTWNTIEILEIEKASDSRSIACVNEPILNQLGNDPLAPPPPVRVSGTIQLDSLDMAAQGIFGFDSAQTVTFAPRKARYVCLQSLSSQKGDPFASAAEIYVLDSKGNPLSRDNWKVYYVDGEELEGEDGRAENAFDDDPESIWHSPWYKSKPGHPHELAVDLGEVQTVAGFRYLPRMGDAPGKIKQFRLYASEKPFKILGAQK